MKWHSIVELTGKLNNFATLIERLLNERKTSAYEIKVHSNDITVTFNWDYDFGYFTITPDKDVGYTVEDEYYVERFYTIQQVVDYLVKKDNDNAR